MESKASGGGGGGGGGLTQSILVFDVSSWC